MYQVMATGKVYRQPAEEEVKNMIADMLRYDMGRVISLDIKPEGYGYRYTAHIESNNYTKARWDSFLIKTSLEG